MSSASGIPNAPIREAGLRELQLASEFGQAIVASGCYDCRFGESCVLLSSRRLIMLEGARHTAYEHISGEFRERGIEVAMYASESDVTNVEASFAASSALTVRPAIRLGNRQVETRYATSSSTWVAPIWAVPTRLGSMTGQTITSKMCA